jgi:hypothetical protein
VDRILLGQLGANGDCLYATILARQLRKDFPNAEITWGISSQCVGLLANNPNIDRVWEVPIPGWEEHEIMWRAFEREAIRRYVRRDFDLILLSQIWPNNYQNFDGTIRPSILRSYGQPITVPIENVVCLNDEEIDRVERFAYEQHFRDFEHRILFECSSKSGQSFITPEIAQKIGRHVYGLLPNATIIFSTHLPMTLEDKRSRYAGVLSLRECAHLTHHCSLFIGCGSGGTVAACSTAAKPLPMMQLLSASTSVFASFAHDFEYFGITDRDILEMTDVDAQTIATCAATICRQGAKAAMLRFDHRIPVRFENYFWHIQQGLIKRHRYLDAARSLLITAERYGWTADLVNFGEAHIVPKLSFDPSWLFPASRRLGEEFRARLMDASRQPAREPRQRPLYSVSSP